MKLLLGASILVLISIGCSVAAMTWALVVCLVSTIFILSFMAVCAVPDLFRRRTIKVFVPLVLLALVPLTVGYTNWPLRIVFPVFASNFEKLANNRPSHTPFQIGPYTILAIETTQTGVTCFWTDLNPSGRSGFIRAPRDQLRFNLFYAIPLGDRWSFIHED